MRKEIKQTIYIGIADIDTGLIHESNTVTLDLRYRGNRKLLHDALDRYIEQVRQGAFISLEFQNIMHPVQTVLPF